MRSYSSLVGRWMPQSEWEKCIPKALKPTLDQLAHHNIQVIRVGLENPKAPSWYVFVSQKFNANEILAELPDSDGLKVSPDGNGIFSIEYACVIFEPGLTKET